MKKETISARSKEYRLLNIWFADGMEWDGGFGYISICSDKTIADGALLNLNGA